ncbi:MAG: hypothetical protein DRQ49_18085 [Gammaproteobacteria bacterium]|nr:MAG: hypothetical protein DRQ49_18085 [Gammaproteobacteria bacterium]RKZ75795.1 MAG: hypothetical protein DRQ57_06170 [Gammaproteobacteria bacterium]
MQRFVALFIGTVFVLSALNTFAVPPDKGPPVPEEDETSSPSEGDAPTPVDSGESSSPDKGPNKDSEGDASTPVDSGESSSPDKGPNKDSDSGCDDQDTCDGKPKLTSIFSIPENQSGTAQFFGGISVNGGAFTLAATNVKQLKADESGSVIQGDTITVEGVIIPDSTHVGQTADIIVVGLYSLTDDSCNPNQGDYYMLKEPGKGNLNNNYCAWIAPDSDYCHHSMPDQPPYYYEGERRTPRSPSSSDYFSRWSGQLDKLDPLYSSVSLSEEPLMLTVEKGMVLYQDKPRYTGHVCINFGYRLKDGTLVFNGEPIQFSVVDTTVGDTTLPPK